MFNIGGGELLVIMLVALLVLGPDKLPGAAKQAGEFLTKMRSMSNDFRQEIKDAVPDEVLDLKREVDETRRSLQRTATDMEIEVKAREKGRRLVAQDEQSKKVAETPEPSKGAALSAAAGTAASGSDEEDASSGVEVDDDTVAPPISTAETAGMFAVDKPDTAKEIRAINADMPMNPFTADADEPTDDTA
jgi:sec-independent protein translocase protein TatB